MFPLKEGFMLFMQLSSTLSPHVLIMMMMIMVMWREAPLNAPSVVLMDCSLDLLMEVFLGLLSVCLYICKCVLLWFDSELPRGPHGFNSRECWSCFVELFAVRSQHSAGNLDFVFIGGNLGDRLRYLSIKQHTPQIILVLYWDLDPKSVLSETYSGYWTGPPPLALTPGICIDITSHQRPGNRKRASSSPCLSPVEFWLCFV